MWDNNDKKTFILGWIIPLMYSKIPNSERAGTYYWIRNLEQHSCQPNWFSGGFLTGSDPIHVPGRHKNYDHTFMHWP